MMSCIARVALRHNINHRLLSCPPSPPTAVRAPLRHLSYCPFVGRLPPSCALRAKYRYSPVSSAERMRMKQPSYDASSDESRNESGDTSGDESESEADDQLLCYVKHDDDALSFNMDMPGVGKEDVKVYVDDRTHTLCVKGTRKMDADKFEDDAEIHPKSYVSEVSLMPLQEYKVDRIKAEMVNGVLKVTVPRVKIEDREDVLLVSVN